MAGHQVKVAVVAETKQFKRAFRGLSKDLGLDRLSRGVKTVASKFAEVGKAAAAASAAVGAAAGAISFKAVQMAGDLEQSTGAVEAVFKQTADKVKAYASTASTSFGVTKNEFQELSVLLGAQLKNGGTHLEQLGDKTKDLITLGADLSAQFGGSTAEAIQSISSALKGERDPIEKYGVSLKQASIDAKAAELGFKKVGGSFSNEAQQAATLALIFEQTADAQGAFNRENNTYAHQVQVLKARVHDLAAEFGTLLLPYATRFVQFLNEKLMPAFDALKAWLENTGIPAFKQFASWIGPKLSSAGEVLLSIIKTRIIPALQSFKDWWTNGGEETISRIGRIFVAIAPAVIAFGVVFKNAFAALNFASKVPTLIGRIQNAFKLLLPIIGSWPFIIAAAIAGIVAGFVLLYQNSETFRNGVNKVWNGIKTGAEAAWNGIKAVVEPVINWFTANVLPTLKQQATIIMQTLGTVAKTLLDALKPVAEALAAVIVPVVKFVVNFIIGAVTSLGPVFTGIGSVIAGVWTYISGGLTGLLQIIQGVVGIITGILTLDWHRVWEGAKNVVSGVWTAIQSFIQGAAKIIGGIIQAAAGLITAVWNGLWNGVKSVAAAAWNYIPNGLRSALSAIHGVMSQLPSIVMNAFSGAGSWLLGIGEKIINGLVQGIKNMFGKVKNALTSLTDLLPSWKGPAERDKTLLAPAGRLIIGGLITSLESQYGAVRRSLNRLTGDIAATDMPSIGIDGPVMARETLSGATINVYALTPNVEVGRVVARALSEWQAQNGVTR